VSLAGPLYRGRSNATPLPGRRSLTRCRAGECTGNEPSTGSGPSCGRTVITWSMPSRLRTLATSGCGRASSRVPPWPLSAQYAPARTWMAAESANRRPDRSTVRCRVPTETCAFSASLSWPATEVSASPDSRITGPRSPISTVMSSRLTAGAYLPSHWSQGRIAGRAAHGHAGRCLASWTLA
jgi:hypothetical protein